MSATAGVAATGHEKAREWAQRLDTVGVWSFDLDRMTATAAREFARAVESLGFRAIWLPEGLGSKEIFAHAGMLLAATNQLVIASGIANMWARDAVAMANGARALVDAYPDRFLLGIGVSHAPTVKIRGETYRRPFEHMREYLDAMDAAPYAGPKVEAPRVLAALGPRMLRLSAERALGAHPYFVPVEHTTQARKALGDGPLLAVEQAAVLSGDAGTARTAARRHMKRYLDLDNYTNNLRRLGWTDADLANGGSDKLVDAIVAWGEAGAVQERIADHRKRGADHVCVQVLRTDLTAPATRELEAIAKVAL
ncbi:MAG TPA: TIGR03620 family F420-dependent LLM class oxidoreductase [Candidatus Limnocylindria bacterium]|jgi:probable F420-dependent oxidoreductase|nr:TIGR03620 family F420-dependent LLM class oxidoreductase [Candidatus Limnocylindria bacterium]